MAEAVIQHNDLTESYTSAGGNSAGDVVQLPSGRAGVVTADISSGAVGSVYVRGVHTMAKTTSMVLLAGGRAYWDHSANKVHYKKVNDRDFYLGRVTADASSGSTECSVALNIDPPYDVDLARDAFLSVITGTQGLNTMGLFRRGGSHTILLSSTSEVQKVDMLSVDGFATGANAIAEFCFTVPSDGAGTAVDVSIGVANGTHATDADSITESIFCHLNANDVNIYFESDDGTTEVAATDSTIDYTEGSAVANRVYVWMDMRDPTDVQIYVNGALVLGATVFNVNVASGPWFLLVHVEKTSSADTYELSVHEARVRFQE